MHLVWSYRYHAIVSLIAIDCRFAALNAGLGRYTRLLVTQMLNLQTQAQYVLIVRSQNEEWIPAGAKVIEADIPHYSIAEQIVLPGIIRSLKADLLFSPHFNVPFFCPIPFVVTVHDLILHRYPNNASFIKRIAYRLQIGRAVRHARSIIAVSAFTASEIADAYGATAKRKTQTVLEGVDDSYVPASKDECQRVRSMYDLQKSFFLYVGNAKQHKNVQTLLDAYEQSGITDTQLILVTGGLEAERLKLPAGCRIIRNVPDADLPLLYSSAVCLVTASLYEGYCLPVAEALACGCPVIASNRTAIPETAAGHAMLVEPNASSFADALKHPPTLERPVVVGTWKQAAETTNDILWKSLA